MRRKIVSVDMNVIYLSIKYFIICGCDLSGLQRVKAPDLLDLTLRSDQKNRLFLPIFSLIIFVVLMRK